MRNYEKLFILLIVLFPSVPGLVRAEEVKTCQYFVEPGFVRIGQERETLFINYENFSLFRLDLAAKSCAHYALLSPGEEEKKSGVNSQFIEEKSKMFAEVVLRRGTGDQLDLEEDHSLIKLTFGPKAMTLLTVQTPRLHIYGQTFYPEFAEFLVQKKHDIYPQLKKIAEYNESFYRKIPLLRRIDVLGLLEILGGVPVKKKGKDTEFNIQFTVVPSGTLIKSLPDICIARL